MAILTQENIKSTSSVSPFTNTSNKEAFTQTMPMQISRGIKDSQVVSETSLSTPPRSLPTNGGESQILGNKQTVDAVLSLKSTNVQAYSSLLSPPGMPSLTDVVPSNGDPGPQTEASRRRRELEEFIARRRQFFEDINEISGFLSMIGDTYLSPSQTLPHLDQVIQKQTSVSGFSHGNGRRTTSYVESPKQNGAKRDSGVGLDAPKSTPRLSRFVEHVGPVDTPGLPAVTRPVRDSSPGHTVTIRCNVLPLDAPKTKPKNKSGIKKILGYFKKNGQCATVSTKEVASEENTLTYTSTDNLNITTTSLSEDQDSQDHAAESRTRTRTSFIIGRESPLAPLGISIPRPELKTTCSLPLLETAPKRYPTFRRCRSEPILSKIPEETVVDNFDIKGKGISRPSEPIQHSSSIYESPFDTYWADENESSQLKYPPVGPPITSDICPGLRRRNSAPAISNKIQEQAVPLVKEKESSHKTPDTRWATVAALYTGLPITRRNSDPNFLDSVAWAKTPKKEDTLPWQHLYYPLNHTEITATDFSSVSLRNLLSGFPGYLWSEHSSFTGPDAHTIQPIKLARDWKWPQRKKVDPNQEIVDRERDYGPEDFFMSGAFPAFKQEPTLSPPSSFLVRFLQRIKEPKTTRDSAQIKNPKSCPADGADHVYINNAYNKELLHVANLEYHREMRRRIPRHLQQQIRPQYSSLPPRKTNTQYTPRTPLLEHQVRPRSKVTKTRGTRYALLKLSRKARDTIVNTKFSLWTPGFTEVPVLIKV